MVVYDVCSLVVALIASKERLQTSLQQEDKHLAYLFHSYGLQTMFLILIISTTYFTCLF